MGGIILIHRTFLLDRDKWDLVLDASGNIAVADAPYAVAQDVASAIQTFNGECWYNTDKGIPYFDKILGQFPPSQYVSSLIVDEALKVKDVATARMAGIGLENRVLTGQVQVIDTDGIESGVIFDQISTSGE